MTASGRRVLVGLGWLAVDHAGSRAGVHVDLSLGRCPLGRCFVGCAPPVTATANIVVVRDERDFPECWAVMSPHVTTADFSASVGATYSSSARFRSFAASHSLLQLVEHLVFKRAQKFKYLAEALSYGWTFTYNSTSYAYVGEMTAACYVDSPIEGLLGALELCMINRADAVRVALSGRMIGVTKGWHEYERLLDNGLMATAVMSHVTCRYTDGVFCAVYLTRGQFCAPSHLETVGFDDVGGCMAWLLKEFGNSGKAVAAPPRNTGPRLSRRRR